MRDDCLDTIQDIPSMKILVVSSVGGHLTEVDFVSRAFGDHQVVLVVNDRCSWPNMPFSRAYQIVHAERDWRAAKNFAEAARILALAYEGGRNGKLALTKSPIPPLTRAVIHRPGTGFSRPMNGPRRPPNKAC